MQPLSWAQERVSFYHRAGGGGREALGEARFGVVGGGWEPSIVRWGRLQKPEVKAWNATGGPGSEELRRDSELGVLPTLRHYI